MGTPNAIAASRLVEYLGTGGTARLGLVRKHAHQDDQPYDPARYPYPKMKHAIARGRRTGRDAEEVWEVVNSASPYRRRMYTEHAEGWLHYLPAAIDTTVLTAKRGRWPSPAMMTIRVSPDLVLRHGDGRIELMHLYMKQQLLDRDTATAIWWLLTQVADDLYENASAVVVDVRRGEAIKPYPRTPDYDAWIQTEVLGYAHMRRLADAA